VAAAAADADDDAFVPSRRAPSPPTAAADGGTASPILAAAGGPGTGGSTKALSGKSGKSVGAVSLAGADVAGLEIDDTLSEVGGHHGEKEGTVEKCGVAACEKRAHTDTHTHTHTLMAPQPHPYCPTAYTI
jgi:hypothetical protein